MLPRSLKNVIKRICWIEAYNLIRMPVEDLTGSSLALPAEMKLAYYDAFNESIKKFTASRVGNEQTDFFKWLVARSYARLAEGHGVYLLFSRDEPVGWMWRAVDGYNEKVFTRLAMQPHETCLFDIFLLPKLRGGDVYQGFFTAVATAESGLGGRYISLIMEGRNTASLRAHQKLGFTHTVARGVVINFLGLRLSRCGLSRVPLANLITESKQPLGTIRSAIKTLIRLS